MDAIDQLSGYRLTETLYEGARTLVYRGVREQDQRPVAIKVLRNAFPSFGELVRFRNQYTMTRHLDSPHLVQPLALERYGNRYALVMPDEGAIALSSYWPQANRSLSETLRISLQLADVLHDLAQERIIHKDIKPANILIHPDSQRIQLIDFSLSSLLPKEQQQLTNPNVLEGTLAYISPEQTGRMNRSLDYRTDFYSLGVTLFELLTGQRPFESRDPMALLHCHMAQSVVFPPSSGPELGSESDHKLEPDSEAIPATLQAIVLKLMAKNAEERYQSALGLKHDLDCCLQQWETTGKIDDFGLGARDVGDRFLIPEKLYGRDADVQALLDAFDRIAGRNIETDTPSNTQRQKQPNAELVLVTGFSGIGKTAVINEIHKPITRQQGYFIRGKFDQLNRNIPFSAFVQAFRSLMGQLLSESEVELAHWKAQILEAVGENGQVLLDVIPELVQIIGPQPAVQELSGNAAQNRFNLLFGKFLRLFATRVHPLVIFLDDLQWVDSASLNLLKLLMDDRETEHLLVLGAYRDNEVSPAHPLMLALGEIEQQGATMTTLTLAPLATVDIDHLVADTLLCSVDRAQPFSQLVYQKTQGNPFFTTQFLEGLYRDGWIAFDAELGHWQCDLAQVRHLALTNDVVAFMVRRLKKLPPETQSALKFAACIGNRFDLATLAVVCEQPQEAIATDLWRGLQSGFVIPESEIYKFFQGDGPGNSLGEGGKRRSHGEGRIPIDDLVVGYRFLHDRVQQAAYALIPEQQKQATHWQIGQRLLQQSRDADRGDRLFEIVNQLNAGRQWELAETAPLIHLNLQAGQKAKAATAYAAALEYFQVSYELLPQDCWAEHYSLTLNVYQDMIEAAYLNLQFESVTSLVHEILGQAQSLLDKIKIYEIQIQDAIGNNRLNPALDLGFDVLEQLGVPLLDPETVDITLPELESLDHFPSMADPHKQAALRIFVSMFSAVYNGRPSLLKPTIWTMVNLCTTAGHTSVSPMAYTVYGMSRCGAGEIDEGYLSGQIALKLLDILDARNVRCKALEQVGGFISHWKEHVSVSIEQFNQGLQSGLDVGDLEYACHSAKNACAHLVLMGMPLDSVQKKQAQYIELGRRLKQQHILSFATIWRQLTLNLRGQRLPDPSSPAQDSVHQSVAPWELVGESFNEREMLPILKAKDNYFSLYVIHFSKLMLCYLFGNMAEAKAMLQAIETYSAASLGSLMSVVQTFYTSLILLQEYREQDGSTSEDHRLVQVADNQSRMKAWARFAPMNHLHKYQLVEAERHHTAKDYLSAIDLYDRAIAGAKAHGYLQEEALANELAARFYLNWGKAKIAAVYMQEAYYCYGRWEAKAKADDLEQRYPQLLAPILHIAPPSLHWLESLTELAAPPSASASGQKTSDRPTLSNAESSSSSINATLDLAAILRASQAISNTISLRALLGQITQIILQNSGGDRCALLLPDRDGSWLLRAITTLDTATLCAEPLENHPHLPSQLIQYVVKTQRAIAATDLSSDLPIVDQFLLQQQPKSILCLPLFNQGKLIAILYLSNQSTRDVFTQERTLILNFLCTEAAISLEKARLYGELEDYSSSLETKVQERTQALEQEVRDRQRAQAEMQTAKDAAEVANQAKSEFLTNMSHELRSPLNAILGFAQLMRQSPSVSAEQQENAAIIHRSGRHLLSLINDVLDMSKIEAGQARLNEIDFDLHQLLRDIHDLFRLQTQEKQLQYRYRCDRSVPQYVRSDARKLRQVLINVLSNAVKFTETGHIEVSVSLSPIQPDDTGEGERLRFVVEDTGLGIAPEEIENVFQPFLQTRTGQKTQEGSGLGLPISRRFVEMMGGDMLLSSRLGNPHHSDLAPSGTTVTFEIQTQAVKTQVLAEGRSQRQLLGLAPGQPRYRVLVVDDQAYNRQLLEKLLVPVGFDLCEATTGDAAIEIWQRWHPHLIWLDLRMANMDGYEVAQGIRQRETTLGLHHERTCILALSASHWAGEREAAIAAGCDDFLAKPFEAQDIFDAMAKQLGLRYRYETSPVAGNATAEAMASSPLSTTSLTSSLTSSLRDSLANLPCDLQGQLQIATRQGHWQDLMELAEQIRQLNPGLADVLTQTLYNFDYRPILEALASLDLPTSDPASPTSQNPDSSAPSAPQGFAPQGSAPQGKE